jgi:regulator of cell morphogenesis and NO signaling
MNKNTKYLATDKMSDLICENYNLLLVMSRFGLSLGFGDMTVEQVCEQQGVHTGTFLAVVNFLEDEFVLSDHFNHQLSLEALMDYLRQSHSYFLDFNLPVIRRKLVDAIDCSQNDLAFLILKFFDEYVSEVRAHMEYENQTVFTYVEQLLRGNNIVDYQIRNFSERHNQIEEKLTELKNIMVKYYPSFAQNHLLHSVLFDIYSCEKDIASHCRVEDYMFIPLITELEYKKTNYAGE